jgi:hypothetical protein
MATTNEQKIDLLNKAIDAIIDAAAETELDFHYFVDSSESVVMKLRSEIFRIENE